METLEKSKREHKLSRKALICRKDQKLKIEGSKAQEKNYNYYKGTIFFPYASFNT